MRLNEFQASPTFKDIYTALQKSMGLQQVGGQARVYRVGRDLGVVFLVNGGPKAVGLCWSRGTKIITSVFVWNNFDASKSPDIGAGVPQGISLEDAGRQISDMIHHGGTGVYEADETEEARKLYIVAKDANGVFFEVPGLDEIAARLNSQYRAQKKNEEDDLGTMEEQYQKLEAKVSLVALNKSTYIKSLLITGAPSSGKTHTVMSTIEKLGLVEGKDYTVLKGSVTDAAAFQALIEQIDGLTIFDDCDSIQETQNGKNMLKNALDTIPVRDVGRSSTASINTKVMPQAEREEFVNALSRLYRGEPTDADLALFENYGPKKSKSSEVSIDDLDLEQFRDDNGDIVLPDPAELKMMLKGESRSQRVLELQTYFTKRMPNRIDFRGRIIFISNLEEDEWDSAVLTRAFRQNMDFSSDDMLAFIERIREHIPAPQLSKEQKDEVLAHIRALHEEGRLKSRINFRLVQQSFDLYLTGPTWKKMVANL